jgi:hypothetical protein
MGTEALSMDRQLQRLFCDACWDGDIYRVQTLLANPELIPTADHSTGLLHAAHRGHTRVVELVLPFSHPLERNSESLWRAARYRHRSCVRLLLPVSDTSQWESWQWDELSPDMAAFLRRLTGG